MHSPLNVKLSTRHVVTSPEHESSATPLCKPQF